MDELSRRAEQAAIASNGDVPLLLEDRGVSPILSLCNEEHAFPPKKPRRVEQANVQQTGDVS